MDYKKILEKLKEAGKNSSNLIVLLLIGVLLVITANFFKPNKNNTVDTYSEDIQKKNNNPQVEDKEDNNDRKNIREEEQELENKLKNTLEQIEGVGRVKVMIYFESGEEQIPAVNINDETSTTEEKDTSGGTRNITQKNNGSTVVVTNDSDGTSNPLIVKKYKPKVTGVFIVAEGAEDNVIQMKITKAVVDLFNIPNNKVNVYPMKN